MSVDAHPIASFRVPLAAAYVRGVRPDLERPSDGETVAAALEAGVRLQWFKDSGVLPRVRAVLGILKGLRPERLLDVGSGRGAFLWPLLTELPALSVDAIDVRPRRVALLEAVARGGLSARLTGHLMDVGRLAFEDDRFDVATVLEVLEHLPEPGRAVAELARVTRRFIIASVPSKPDDNPEHLRLFDASSLGALFFEVGASRVQIEYVPGHIVAVARLARSA